jgi:hypothetical protein
LQVSEIQIIQKRNNFHVLHQIVILLLTSTFLLWSINYKHELPSLQCSEDQSLADFQLQKGIQQNHPGACSLEFQSVMKILMECMLRWDIKKQASKGKGILDTVVAFSTADKEQGRKTLHRHWQVWVTEINQIL